jgi:hypothetical protein
MHKLVNFIELDHVGVFRPEKIDTIALVQTYDLFFDQFFGLFVGVFVFNWIKLTRFTYVSGPICLFSWL